MQSAITFVNLLACLAAAIIFFYGAKNDQAKGAATRWVLFGLSISGVFAAGVVINLIQLVA
jgi:hypothetical protein